MPQFVGEKRRLMRKSRKLAAADVRTTVARRLAAAAIPLELGEV
jgi:hypothetical protein